MGLKIKRDRSNIDVAEYIDIYDDIFRKWNAEDAEKLSKHISAQIQDAINNEIMKQVMDSTPCIDSKHITDIIDTYNHPVYRPTVTVKFNEDNQIVLEYENNL